MARKQRPTVEEHKVLARTIIDASCELQRSYILVANSYPHQSREVRKLKQVLAALDAARCALDTALCREDPERYSTEVYYLTQSERAAELGNRS